MTAKPKDFPLADVIKLCERLVKDGNFIVQKWTCGGCGQRISARHLNFIAHTGHCGHCNHVTDIAKTGCNYTLIAPGRPTTLEEMSKILGLSDPPPGESVH